MNLRDPLGEGYQNDNEGIEWYTASISELAADDLREMEKER